MCSFATFAAPSFLPNLYGECRIGNDNTLLGLRTMRVSSVFHSEPPKRRWSGNLYGATWGNLQFSIKEALSLLREFANYRRLLDIKYIAGPYGRLRC